MLRYAEEYRSSFHYIIRAVFQVDSTPYKTRRNVTYWPVLSLVASSLKGSLALSICIGSCVDGLVSLING
jgi:hypothetical protein